MASFFGIIPIEDYPMKYVNGADFDFGDESNLGGFFHF
jgi:hypothetical protein